MKEVLLTINNKCLSHYCTHRLYDTGIGLNVLSIALVGFTAMLIDNSSSIDAADAAATTTADAAAVITSTSAGHVAGSKALVGVALILFGALTQSFQYVFEEKVMTGSSSTSSSSSSVKIPPLLLVRLNLSIYLSPYHTTCCSFTVIYCVGTK